LNFAFTKCSFLVFVFVFTNAKIFFSKMLTQKFGFNPRAGAPPHGYGSGDSQGLPRGEGGPPYSYSREVQGVGMGREEAAPPHNNTRVVVAAIPSDHRQRPKTRIFLGKHLY
jgi:hypothetical protein